MNPDKVLLLASNIFKVMNVMNELMIVKDINRNKKMSLIDILVTEGLRTLSTRNRIKNNLLSSAKNNVTTDILFQKLFKKLKQSNSNHQCGP